MKEVILSIVALLISMLSILMVATQKNTTTSIDWSVVLGVLSVLVTALIGWQIWNVIDFEQKIDKKIKERNDILSSAISNLDLYNAGMLNLLNSQNFFNIGSHKNALIAGIEAIACFSSIVDKTAHARENQNHVNKQINKAINLLLELKNENTIHEIQIKDKESFLVVLPEVCNDRTDVQALLDWIENMETAPPAPADL